MLTVHLARCSRPSLLVRGLTRALGAFLASVAPWPTCVGVLCGGRTTVTADRGQHCGITPFGGAAVLLRRLRGRPEDLPRDRVFQDRDAGDDAPPCEAVQMEALLQGGHLREGPHAVAAARPARPNRAQGLSLIVANPHNKSRYHDRSVGRATALQTCSGLER